MTAAEAGGIVELTAEPVGAGELLVQHVPRLRDTGGAVFASDGDYRDTIAWWNDMQTAPVGPRTLTGATRFEGASMWQFLPSYVWPEVYWAIELVKALDAAAPSGAFRAIPPGDGRTDALFAGVVRAYAQARGVEVELPVNGAHRPAAARRVARAVRARLRRPERSRDGIAPGGMAGGDGPRVLFASIPRHWAPDPDRPGERHDEQFGPLYEPLREAGFRDFAGIDCVYDGGVAAQETLRDRIAAEGDIVGWRSFDSYAAPDATASRKAAAAQLSGVWRDAQADPGFEQATAFRGVPLLPALADVLKTGLTTTLPDCAALRATARAILAAEHPDAIVASYEAGPLARALVVEGARIGIPAVGLMHGMIFDNHYDYLHARVGPDPADPAQAVTIPARTCVWGPAWERSLTEAGSYPREAVVVTGSWRYDSLAARRERRAEYRARLGVADDATPLVAVLGSIQETPRFVAAALDAIDEPAQARIRLHPGDDRPSVRAVLSERGLPEDVLVDDGTLADLLIAADAVVSQISTAVAESILIGRPTVLVDPIGAGRTGGYDAGAACHIVRDSAALPDAIDRVLHDEDLKARLAEASHAYAEDHFLHLDGKAGHRAAQAIAAVAGVEPA